MELRLARTCNHGVNPIEGYREHHPQDGGEEQAAHDFTYWVSVEEAPVGTLVGEAFGSGL